MKNLRNHCSSFFKFKFKFKFIFIFIFNCILLQSIFAKAEIPEYLSLWDKNPKEASLLLPAKSGAISQIKKFTLNDLENNNFVTIKDNQRKQICAHTAKGYCPFEEPSFTLFEFADDFSNVTKFVGEPVEKNIQKLDIYRYGAAEVAPWSGHYWPHSSGGIGARYADPNYPDSDTFIENYEYYQKNYLKKPHRIKKPQILSPAEKYDLLVDDPKWTMTKEVWAEGKHILDQFHKVEPWTGICHGWAPAAIYVPEPIKSFEVDIPNLEDNLIIYPDDVKAMISQLWAQADMGVEYVGGRCDIKNPKTDENGRILSKECFDANPGSWHLSLIHFMGKLKKSFVFDATYDYEVWNQPVLSYSFKYFNPNTNVTTDHLEEALIDYKDIKKDPYRKYRSPKLKNIVGVEMKLKYVIENLPTPTESIKNIPPEVTEVTYYYDLELDQDNNIIGGEWYQLAHPDIFWRPDSKSIHPKSRFEPKDSDWEAMFPVPIEFTMSAQRASRKLIPLSTVIDQLVKLSR